MEGQIALQVSNAHSHFLYFLWTGSKPFTDGQCPVDHTQGEVVQDMVLALSPGLQEGSKVGSVVLSNECTFLHWTQSTL